MICALQALGLEHARHTPCEDSRQLRRKDTILPKKFTAGAPLLPARTRCQSLQRRQYLGVGAGRFPIPREELRGLALETFMSGFNVGHTLESLVLDKLFPSVDNRIVPFCISDSDVASLEPSVRRNRILRGFFVVPVALNTIRE